MSQSSYSELHSDISDDTDFFRKLRKLRKKERKRSWHGQTQATSEATPIGPPIHAQRYNFSHRKRGKVLVFNHSVFEGNSRRNGADEDGKNIWKTFQRLGFEVIMNMDRKRAEIMNILKEVAAEDHTDEDCIAVVVMSHGDQKRIHAFDQSYETSKLWEPFRGDNCKSLLGKPKLFFIQACRGTSTDPGSRIIARPNEFIPCSGTLTDSSQAPTYVIPNMADFFVAYATYDGHYAFRNPKKGSWFVQKLCQILKERGDVDEICQMMTTVNRRVAFEYSSYSPENKDKHNMKQMPNFFSSLTREVYFTPKDHQTNIEMRDRPPTSL